MRMWHPAAWALALSIGLDEIPAAARDAGLHAIPVEAPQPRWIGTLEQRLAARRSVEEVYSRSRLWPASNKEPRPTPADSFSEAALERQVTDALRKSKALELFWDQPITPRALQAEIARMARDTKDPKRLRDVWAALNNDPTAIAETLARPFLADARLRDLYAFDERFHAAVREQARRAVQQAENMPGAMRSMGG